MADNGGNGGGRKMLTIILGAVSSLLVAATVALVQQSQAIQNLASEEDVAELRMNVETATEASAATVTNSLVALQRQVVELNTRVAALEQQVTALGVDPAP